MSISISQRLMPSCCQCNGAGRCSNCSCKKGGKSRADCLPSRRGRCENLKSPSAVQKEAMLLIAQWTSQSARGRFNLLNNKITMTNFHYHSLYHLISISICMEGSARVCLCCYFILILGAYHYHLELAKCW